MNSKYYTPTIDEFHVEFEYERNIGSSTEHEKWKKIDDFSNAYEYEDDPLYGVIKDLRCENIRVKYLDKEDIVDCGFEHDKTVFQEFYAEKDVFIKPDVYGYMIWKIKCQHRPDTQWFKLEALFEDGEWSTLFEGKIKNKSELKKLIKQLGIDDN